MNDRAASPARAVDEARKAIARAQAASREARPDEAIEWYEAALEWAGSDPAGLAARADALRGAGIARQSRAEWPEAERDFRASRKAALQLADDGRVGRAENNLGAVAFERGDWTEAERHYDVARRAAQRAGDDDLLAQVMNNLGTLLAARGEHARAEAAFRRAHERFERLERHPCAARALNNLGLVLVQQGRYPLAALAYDRALHDCKRSGDAVFAAKIRINQARLALARQDPIRAHAAAVKAWTFARRLDDGPVAAGAQCLLGEIALALGDFVGATYHLRRALKIASDGRAPLVEAETWVQIGNLYRDQGQLERAVDTWQYARVCYRRLGARAESDRLGERIHALTGVTEPEAVGAPERGRAAAVAAVGERARTGTYDG